MTNLATVDRTFSNLLRLSLWLGLASLLAAGISISASASEDSGVVGIGGEGSASISGFMISDIHYTRSEADPSRLAGISFEVVAADGRTAAEQVTASVVAGQPETICLPQGGLRWICPLDVSAASADALRVSAIG